MNLTLPAGGKSPPSSLDMECPQNCIRQKLEGAPGLETAAAQLSDSLRDHIQTAARKLGITKKIAWQTFRHTFSSVLKSNGEDVKVVQELLPHSTARMTLGSVRDQRHLSFVSYH